MIASSRLLEKNKKEVRLRWGTLTGKTTLRALARLTEQFGFSVADGDLILLENSWYVTHSGLLRMARRSHCAGIHVEPVSELSDPSSLRWAFKATVYKSRTCRGFVGFGDANPSNVSPLVRGAEMRVAETRAVNRALRKAFAIGICSAEEIGSVDRFTEDAPNEKKVPQPSTGQGNGNANGSVRDRLCVIIRQHQLNPDLVKAYLADFCSVKTLRDASREQVENFVAHLADWAERDRNALLCQLNSYLPSNEGAA